MIRKVANRLSKIIYPALSSFYSRKSLLTTDTARRTLMEYAPMPQGEPVVANTICPPVCDLQIIIPAYNVEAYLEDCLESVLSQETKYTYKIVLIDDGSTDNTGRIADQYLSNEKVVVIHQENRGFSGARNTGLKQLFGKYIMFVDSDDMLCPGAIESLMDMAVEYDSDIVEGGAFSLRGEKKKEFFSYSQKKVLPTALGVFHGQPWAKIFKAECFERIVFPEGFWFEDSILSFLIYPVKNRVSVVDHFAYIYRINPKGISVTSKGRVKSVDSYWITEKLMKSREELNIPVDDAFLKKFERQLVLNQKRIEKLPEYIQESVFVLSSELLRKYFSDELIEKNKRSKVIRALTTKDWGMYQFYCKYC